MKKNYFFILFLSCCFSWAQKTEPTISLTFSDITLKEVIIKIEKQTGYHFYFVEEWLDKRLISGSYNEVSIHELLDSLFKETAINFYVYSNNQIILTQNNVIYENLPSGFFEENSISISKVKTKKPINNSPIFYTESKILKNKKLKTIRIGKEDKNHPKNYAVLTGKVVDAKTSKPISGVSIKVKGYNLGVSTNTQGEYALKIPLGMHIIETRYLSYNTIKTRFIIFNDGIHNFNLTENYESLDEVVIETNKKKLNTETAIDKANIDVKEIKNIPLVLGERDVFKVALTLPGITSAGEGASGFNVRGGKTDQNLVLLENAVMYNPTHLFGMFSAVNPFSTSDISIYKGAIPAKYGGRLSSIFDIKTKNASLKKIKGEASIGPVTSNLVLEAPLIKEEAGILIGGRGTYSNWILRSLDNDELRKSKASYFDVILKYDHKINENNDISVHGYYSRDTYSITSDSLYSYTNRIASLKWTHKFNAKNSGEIIVTNSSYNFNINYDGETNTNFKQDYKINDFKLKLNLKYKPSKTHTFSYGASSMLYGVEPGNRSPKGNSSIITALSIPKEKGLESAIYISNLFTISDAITLDTGIRYSIFNFLGPSQQRVYKDGLPKNEANILSTKNYSKNKFIKTYSGPEIRFSARYLFSPKLAVKTSYSSTYQYIHSLTNNTTISPIDTWKLSDSNIKPQRGNQYSLGLFNNFADTMFELSLEGYFKKMNNVLDYKVGAQLFLNEAIEQEVLQGEGKAYGIEFLIKKMKGKLNGWLGYTYSRSFLKLNGNFAEEIVNNGKYFPSNYDKPHDFSAVANYKLTKRFSLSANFVYQTGRPVTVPVGNFVINGSEFVFYSDRNAYRIPDYYRLDISLNVEGNHKIKKLAHSFWNLSIYNVLGRNNPYSVFFVTDNGEVKAYQSSIFSIPIPTITYNLKF